MKAKAVWTYLLNAGLDVAVDCGMGSAVSEPIHLAESGSSKLSSRRQGWRTVALE